MESIFSNLSNPSWWFSTIVIGIIASVLAGFIKDWVSAWLAKRVKSYRIKRLRTLRRKANRLRIIKRDAFLFIALGFRLTIDIFLAIFGFILAYAYGPTSYFFTKHPEYDPIRYFFNPTLSYMVIWAVTIAFLFFAAQRFQSFSYLTVL